MNNEALPPDDVIKSTPVKVTKIADKEIAEYDAVPATEGVRPPAETETFTGFDDVVSGRFDEDANPVESAATTDSKRVLLPQRETPKLHKILAQAGLGSRLEMEQLIQDGRITVNSEPAHVGQRVQYGDQIKVNGKVVRFRIDPPAARVIAYHKPAGEVVTHDDPQNRPTVFRKLPRLQHGKWQSVGRLDLNTEGLLLFTSSGELANQLMHPRFGLEREYAVRVLGALKNEEKQRLIDGVRLDDGTAQFGSIEDGGGEGANCWYRVTISEGRNREVRRMFEAVGHAVSRLIRIRYGAMQLPRGLRRGAWLELDERDIGRLMQAVGMQRALATAPAAPAGRGGRVAPKKPGFVNGPGYGGVGKSLDKQGYRGKRPNELAGRRFDASTSAPAGGAASTGGQGTPEDAKAAPGFIGAESFTRRRQELRRGSLGGAGGSKRRSR